MKLSTATLIHESMVNNMSFYEDEPRIRESYVGRGVSSKETSGIVCDSVSDVLTAIGFIMQELLELPLEEGDCGYDELSDLASDLQRGFSTDSMGLSTIVY